MPRVPDRPSPMPKPPRVCGAKGLTPVPDGFVRDRDTALREEVFDVAKAQGEPVVEPDGVADDGGGKSVAGIADDVDLLGTWLLCPWSGKLTMPRFQ
jgi:hypothetical protein